MSADRYRIEFNDPGVAAFSRVFKNDVDISKTLTGLELKLFVNAPTELVLHVVDLEGPAT